MRGHGAMLAFSVAVSGSFILGSFIAQDIAPQALTAARFFVAVLVLAGVVTATGQLRPVHLQAPWRYGIMGSLFAIYFVLMFYALRIADPVNLAVIFTLSPLLSAGADWVLNARRAGGVVLGAILIGAVGALWVIFEGSLARLLAFDLGRGELLFLLGTIAHAFYPASMPRLSRAEPAAVVTLCSLGAAAVLIGVAGAPQIAATDWMGLRPLVWVTIAYLGVIATALTFFLVKFATTQLPSAKVMAYTYLVPFWVALGMGMAAGQWPAPRIYLGGVLIAGALVILLLEGGAKRGAKS